MLRACRQKKLRMCYAPSANAYSERLSTTKGKVSSHKVSWLGRVVHPRSSLKTCQQPKQSLKSGSLIVRKGGSFPLKFERLSRSHARAQASSLKVGSSPSTPH